MTYNNLGEETQRTLTGTVYYGYGNPSPFTYGTFTLQRRPDGLTTEMDATGNNATTRALTYDAWGEMTEEDTGGQADKRSFGYDANGNRTGFTEYQWAGQIGADTDTYDEGNQTKSRQFLYGSPVDLSSGYVDANGNTLMTLDQGNSLVPLASCLYYPDNRMKSMMAYGSTEGSQYDGAGRLIQRTDPGAGNTTAYGYDGSDCILDYNTNQLDERMYGLVSQFVNSSWGSQSGEAFVSYDPMGNAAVVTDANGNPTYCSSELYGNLCSPQSESNFLSSWGYRYRSSANLFQVGARVYDPGQGRFLQQDPLSFGSGDFTYAGNDPANAVDPTGLLFLHSNLNRWCVQKIVIHANGRVDMGTIAKCLVEGYKLPFWPPGDPGSPASPPPTQSTGGWVDPDTGQEVVIPSSTGGPMTSAPMPYGDQTSTFNPASIPQTPEAAANQAMNQMGDPP